MERGVEEATEIRVRYAEVDRMNVAWHGHYLAWFEAARTDFLRRRGTDYRTFEDAGSLLMVVESGVRHRGPAGYDDVLAVVARLAEARGATVRFEYEVRRGDDLLATGHTVLAHVGRDGRPRRLPADLVAAVRGKDAEGAASKPPARGGGEERTR